MPAFPAYALLGAAVVLLCRGVRARPAAGSDSLAGHRGVLALAVAAVLFVVAPLAVVAATPPLQDAGRQAVRQGDSLVPVSAAIAPQATVDGDSVRLSWRSRHPPRRGSSTASCEGTRQRGGTLRRAAEQRGRRLPPALPRQSGGGPRKLVRRPPGPGTWTYRVGVSANWLDDVRLGDVYVVSDPVTVTVP